MEGFRVLSVSEWYAPVFSGVAIRLARFNRRMRRCGRVRAKVLTRTVSGEPRRAVLEGTPIERVPLHLNILERSSGFKLVLRVVLLAGFVLECMLRLRAALRRNQDRFDILHAYVLSWFSILSLPLAKRLGKRTILEITLDGGMMDSLQSGSRSPVERLRRWAISHADRIVTHSPYISRLAVLGGLPVEAVREYPNPVDIDRYCPADGEVRNALRRKTGIRQDARVLLFVGGITERKGVDTLLDAFGILSKSHPDVLLILAGPTDKYEPRFFHSLKDRIRRSCLDDKVMFTGKRVENVEDFMRASDIFVFASRHEGFGTVIVEAMACALPVVVKRIPWITEYQIEHGRDGMIVRSDRPEDFALAVDRLLADSDLAGRIGRAARQTAVSRFSSSVVDRAVLSLYKELTQA